MTIGASVSPFTSRFCLNLLRPTAHAVSGIHIVQMRLTASHPSDDRIRLWNRLPHRSLQPLPTDASLLEGCIVYHLLLKKHFPTTLSLLVTLKRLFSVLEVESLKMVIMDVHGCVRQRVLMPGDLWIFNLFGHQMPTITNRPSLLEKGFVCRSELEWNDGYIVHIIAMKRDIWVCIPLKLCPEILSYTVRCTFICVFTFNRILHFWSSILSNNVLAN